MASIFQRTEEASKEMKKAGLSRIESSVLKLLRPSIRLVAGEESEQAVTRLGGYPNLPTEIAWPSRRSGDPHSFLAQVDLEGLPVCEALPLPSVGTLFFFCDAEYLPDASDQEDVKDGIKVIYCPNPPSAYSPRTPPRGLSSEYVFKSLSLKPTLDLTAPALDVWEIRSLDLSDAESYAYCDLFAQVAASDGSVHRMGGYPNQVQYSKLKTADDWQLLMQLDSEDEAGMMWGDVGKLYFTILERDLKSQRFDKTWMDWQCG